MVAPDWRGVHPRGSQASSQSQLLLRPSVCSARNILAHAEPVQHSVRDHERFELPH
jgi:hypothetical protein